MNIADELRKLQDMHENGSLTDEEFAQAKAALLKSVSSAQAPAFRKPQPPADVPDEERMRKRLRAMQIIAGSMLIGVGVFLTIALAIVHGQNNGQGMMRPVGLPMMTLIALVILGIEAPLAFIIPTTIARSNLKQIAEGAFQVIPAAGYNEFTTDNGMLMIVRQKAMIVGMAMLEGTAFMGCLAYMIEGKLLDLGVIGVCVALQLSMFPTERGVCSWLERQSAALAELRQQQELSGER